MIVKLYVSESFRKMVSEDILEKIFKRELKNAGENNVGIMLFTYAESSFGDLVEVHAPFTSSHNIRVANAVKAAYQTAISHKGTRFEFCLNPDL